MEANFLWIISYLIICIWSYYLGMEKDFLACSLEWWATFGSIARMIFFDIHIGGSLGCRTCQCLKYIQRPSLQQPLLFYALMLRYQNKEKLTKPKKISEKVSQENVVQNGENNYICVNMLRCQWQISMTMFPVIRNKGPQCARGSRTFQSQF